MSSSSPSDTIRNLCYGLVSVSLFAWRNLVNGIVPQPYLDEVFHVPQAQAYWAGNWSRWDPKITTPPGLYAFSHLPNLIQAKYIPDFQPTTASLRLINLILLYSLSPLLFLWTAISKKKTSTFILRKELVVIEFPLLFFFSALYYTDILSTVTVVVTCIFWTSSNQASGGIRVLLQLLTFFSGLASIATRQTNIFWVAVFLGGLQVIEVVKQHVGARKVHDPPIAEAFFEDFPITSISLLQDAIPLLPSILTSIWPQICLLIAFGGFVVWNQGVVLGDKSNHVATIHLAQLLYLFPFLMFFSWPTILPFVTHPSLLSEHLPRRATVIILLLVTGAIVHFNTIVHPFTLADNRHYTFYVFRYLLYHPMIKYLVTPIYLFCGWLALLAMGGTQHVPLINRSPGGGSTDNVRVSFVLVWLLSTALSVVTAPLVEPRYFIIPWLIWRMHVPDPELEGGDDVKKDDQPKAHQAESTNLVVKTLRDLSDHTLWIELAWYAAINFVTGRLFLYHGFGWPQEPKNVQRFMW